VEDDVCKVRSSAAALGRSARVHVSVCEIAQVVCATGMGSSMDSLPLPICPLLYAAAGTTRDRFLSPGIRALRKMESWCLSARSTTTLKTDGRACSRQRACLRAFR
jgi:hypothetical protein